MSCPMRSASSGLVAGESTCDGSPGSTSSPAVVVAPDLGVDAGAGRVRARVDVGEEPDGRPRFGPTAGRVAKT